MQLSNTPFPKASFKSFAKIVAMIGLSVVFVLVAFQPFGTASFQHEYKYIILAGYGLAVFLGSCLTHLLSSILYTKSKLSSWTILDEVLLTFLSVLFSLFACYLYWVIAFGANFNLGQLSWFLLYAGLVAILPVSFYLAYIYNKFKEVRHAQFSFQQKSSLDSNLIQLEGKAKGEKLTVNTSDLYYVTSSENYVIIHFMEDGEIKKRMLRCTLTNMVGQLGDPFIKCHRSFAINKNKIMGIEGNKTNLKVKLINISELIPVSRAHVDIIRKVSQLAD